jgi:pimeloyl-ACP methyl ester carboxylesterase
MLKNSPIALTDLRAYSRLAVDATLGFTDVVENLHHNVARLPRVFGTPSDDPAQGIAGFVYRSIRGVTRKVGSGVEALIGAVVPAAQRGASPDSREALRAALNGIVGDHLDATDNPLRIEMNLRHAGRPLQLDRIALAGAIPSARSRIVVLVHGLCMSDRQWRRRGHDHGAALARDAGFTPIYLQYNSGLHISCNGRQFAEQLDALVREWPVPVEEIALVGYSMGGLVIRSACHLAEALGMRWGERLRSIVFLGTPHAGSPLERNGNRLDAILGASPYTAAFARLGKVRSAGITDLRHASLLDDDWHGRDRFARGPRGRTAVALPAGVRCYAIAGTLAKKPNGLRGAYVGDGLVPVASALGRHVERARRLGLPPARQWIAAGVGHLDLLDNADVYARIRAWITEKPVRVAGRRRSGRRTIDTAPTRSPPLRGARSSDEI